MLEHMPETMIDEKVKQSADEQYGEDFSSFLNRAITAFYER